MNSNPHDLEVDDLDEPRRISQIDELNIGDKIVFGRRSLSDEEIESKRPLRVVDGATRTLESTHEDSEFDIKSFTVKQHAVEAIGDWEGARSYVFADRHNTLDGEHAGLVDFESGITVEIALVAEAESEEEDDAKPTEFKTGRELACDGGRPQDDETELHVPDEDCVIMTDGGVVTDKDGKPVDDRVAELMDRLENETNADRVLCHYYESGRIGYWSKTRDIRGRVVDIAQEEGYRLDHATTRDGSGYAELVPMTGTDDNGSDGGERVLMTDGGRDLPETSRSCVQCDSDAVSGSRYCSEHGRLVTDGGRDSFQEDCEAQLGDTLTEPIKGSLALDLVTRQVLYIRKKKFDTLEEHYEAEGYNLMTYKTHPYLPVRADDSVFECVFVGSDPERIHNPGDTYDFPRGRLAHIPVEQAWGGDLS